LSYESSLAAGWESFAGDGYEYEVDVEDACNECQVVPKHLTTMAYLDASDGDAYWDCPDCGAKNWFAVKYGYIDIAEAKQYDL
jgi:hypothetical protein